MKKIATIIAILICIQSTNVYAQQLNETPSPDQGLVNTTGNNPKKEGPGSADKTTDPEDPRPPGELLEELVPSQDDLFDNSHRLQNGDVSFADGDLEKEVAPSILRILVTFSAILLMIYFTFLGIRLAISRDNEEVIKKTKDGIINGLIGVVIIAASFGIIVGILRLFDSF